MTHFCASGGFVVSGDYPIPDDPTAVSGVAGCSRLVCSQCKQAVRWIVGAEPRPGAQPRHVYALEDWKAELVRASERARFYSCACTSFLARPGNVYPCIVEEPDLEAGEVTFPWRCAGHETAVLPVEVEGVVVAADTDLAVAVRAAVVRDTARAAGRPPAGWPSALYRRLVGHPRAGDVSRAMAHLLEDASPPVRAAALAFFAEHPAAPGAERVATIARDRPDLFSAKTKDPTRSPWKLEDRLHETLGRRLFARDPAGAAADGPAVALARAAACRPHREDTGLLDALVATELPWVIEHAADLARADAKKGWRQLLSVVATHDVGSLGRVATALVRGGVIDAASVTAFARRGLDASAQYVLAQTLSST